MIFCDLHQIENVSDEQKKSFSARFALHLYSQVMHKNGRKINRIFLRLILRLLSVV